MFRGCSNPAPPVGWTLCPSSGLAEGCGHDHIITVSNVLKKHGGGMEKGFGLQRLTFWLLHCPAQSYQTSPSLP